MSLAFILSVLGTLEVFEESRNWFQHNYGVSFWLLLRDWKVPEICNTDRGLCNAKQDIGELEEEHNSKKMLELEFILTGVLAGFSGEEADSNLILFGQLNKRNCHLMECGSL